MAYQIPLLFIDVSEDVSVCATRIVAVMSTETYQARLAVKAEKKAGTLVNAAGREKVRCAIFMDNGTLIASPYSVKMVTDRIMKAQEIKPRKSTYSEDKAVDLNEGTELADEILRQYAAGLEEDDAEKEIEGDDTLCFTD